MARPNKAHWKFCRGIVKGKPIGLIYADRPDPGDIAIPEKELSLLKLLRNQAVLAIRQSL